MGNALLTFRGLAIPLAEVINPLPNWSQADGTFNNIYCNTIVVANPPGPAQVPGLEVVEYENSDTDFSMLQIKSNPDGPFEIVTVGAGEGSSRSLDITSTRDMFLSSGGLMQLETFSENPILFGTDSQLQWQIDAPNGDFLPMQDAAKSIGNNSDARVQNIYVQNTVTSAIINIGGGDLPIVSNNGTPFWVFGNDGVFTVDGANPNPDLGRTDGRAPRNIWINRSIGIAVQGNVDTFTGFVTLTFQDNGDGTARLVASTLNGPVTIFSPIPFS